MIKRKININQNNPNADYLDLLEIHQDRDFKNMSKKNLEEVYSKVLKNLDELKSKQSEIEFKIDTVKERNDFALTENDSLKTEYAERKDHTKNLELLIILVLELKASTDRNRVKFPGSKEAKLNENIYSNSKSISEFSLKNENQSLDTISKSFTDEEMGYIMKDLVENCNDSVLKSMVTRCLEKYNLNLEDLDISIYKKSKPETKFTYSGPISTTENSPAQIKENSQKFISDNTLDMFSENKRDQPFENACKNKFKFGSGSDLNINSGNISTPTSIQSTNECIFGTGNKNISTSHPKAGTGNYDRRKKNEDQGCSNLEICTGDLNLNRKEKESMFEEVNGVTPFLISSPNMSPARIKRFDSMNTNNEYNETLYRPTATALISPYSLNNYYSVVPSNSSLNNIHNNQHKYVYYNQPKYNPENFFSFCDDNINSSNLLNKKHN
jgi:hypothetical protein